jgi:transposase
MTQFTLPLDIESLEITKQSFDTQGNIIFDVVSKNDHSTCHKCGKPATKRAGTAPARMVRHVSILDTPVYLRITPIRYSCEFCDDHTTTTEQYDWCDRNASTTQRLEEYLMRFLINSTIADVSRKETIGERIVENILDRQVAKKVDWSKITALNTIGIDEITLKKGHDSYVTVVSAKINENSSPIVIGVLPNREKETVKTFLESIPALLKQTVKHVCTDMYDGFVNAAIEVFGVQYLVIDRYHVSKLYRKPLDQLRISEMSRLKTKLTIEEYAKLEGMMWILRKNHECLSEANKVALELLYKYSPILKKAHTYALRLTHIFNSHIKRKSALAKIDRWIKSVKNSDLKVFNGFLITLNKYKSCIGNYFKARKNSGFVEGLNNKIKVLKRRCYGLFDTESLFQRLFLDLQGGAIYA